MREEALVAGAPHGHAHALLAILGWDNVGSEPDDTEALWAAALLISSSLALLLTAVWLAFQRCCCSAARRRRLRLRLYGPPPADSALSALKLFEPADISSRPDCGCSASSSLTVACARPQRQSCQHPPAGSAHSRQ